MGENLVEIVKVRTDRDKELIYYWRQNELIYKNFLVQKNPLIWRDHIGFWLTYNSRIDWIILYNKRRIGSVYFKILNSKELDVGFYIGDVSMWGKGIAYEALTLSIDWGRTNLELKINKNL